MAQPYLISMEHSEWHSKQLLKQRAMKRPLGRLESEHRYQPPQPVLSCRTVDDVDPAGGRTYGAKSTTDIINDQHKLIHAVYCRARNSKSAPPRSNRVRYSVDYKGNWRTLRFLTVEGVNSQYPSSSVKQPTGEILISRLKRRPCTTGSIKTRAKTLTDSRFNADAYIAAKESVKEFKNVNNQIREHWTPRNHSLNEGNFVRGKPNEVSASLDPKTGSQWLTFGGGDVEESAGLIDSFAEMKNEVFYHIDGKTGVQAAKQLKKGDKIRICRNGSAVSQDAFMSGHGSDSHSAADTRSETAVSSSVRIPLCWTDQVAYPETKILSGKKPKERSKPSDVRGSNPVVFNEDHDDETWRDYIPKGNGLDGKDLYRIQSRSKKRIGLNGQPSESSTITNLTIDRLQNVKDKEAEEDLSVEDILQKRLHIKSRSQVGNTSQCLETIAASPRGGSGGDEGLDNDSGQGTQRSDKDVSRVRMKDGGSRSSSRATSYRTNNRHETQVISRPTSQQYEDIDSLVVRNSSSDVTPRAKSDKKPYRILSAKRVSPAKPLHKTGAAKGVTFATGDKTADTAYIQIAHPISVPSGKEDTLTKSDSVRKDNNSTHSAVRNPSVYEDSASESNTTEVLVARSTPVMVQEEDVSNHTPISMKSPVGLSPAGPSPRDITDTEDVKYAINIPTADLAESEINSTTDILDAR